MATFKLFDLDVDEIHGVTKGAINRPFLIAKSATGVVNNLDNLAFQKKVARLKALGFEPNEQFMRLAKSGAIDPFACIDAEISRLSKRVEKSGGPALGDGVFADLMFTEREIPSMLVEKAAYDADEAHQPADEDDDAKRKARHPETGRFVADDEECKAKAYAAAKAAYDAAEDEDENDRKQKALVAYQAALKNGRPGHSADDQDDDDMSDEDRRARGMRATHGKSLKSMMARYRKYGSDAFLSGSISAERAFDMSDFVDRGPRIADSGEDALGREYADGVMERIAGPFAKKIGGDPDAIPEAGAAGSKVVGDTQSLAYDAQRFMPSNEGNAGHIVEDKGNPPARPNLGRDGAYSMESEGAEAGGVRVGDMRLLSPESSGIAPASGARFPDATDVTLKRIRKNSKVGSGVFSNLIQGPEAGQTVA